MTKNSQIESLIKESITKLLDYCKKNNWAGYDPFDGLNSQVIKTLPMLNNKYVRLVFIQGMKRLPINLRPFFLVPREQNPKGLALFISALLNLRKINFIDNDGLILNLINRLIELRSPDHSNYCWGYNFDWQNRFTLLPKFHPNIIGTTFAGNALLDAYEIFGEEKYLEMVKSAGLFILNGLNISTSGEEICFSYTPYDYGKVHNANMLGAAYLARLYYLTKEDKFLDYAQKAMRYSVNKQNEDGSWYYGEDSTQRWIDNFHTGYNLSALKMYSNCTKSNKYENNILIGFQYYINNFFTTEIKLPKYFHDRLYPIDIHSVAYSIITLVEFSHLDKNAWSYAEQLIEWVLNNMQDKAGYFYYQKKKFYTNKIAYMRWSQAWMLFAMSLFIKKYNSKVGDI